MRGFDHQYQKRDWTSAGASSDALLDILCDIRPAVMSLLRSTIPEYDKKKSLAGSKAFLIRSGFLIARLCVLRDSKGAVKTLRQLKWKGE